MALSEDQRALLRLLVGGDSFEQVGEVLGTSADDVRERATRAVTELEDSGEDPELASAARQRVDELDATPADGGPLAPGGDGPATRRAPRLAWITIALAVVALGAGLAVALSGGDSDDSGVPEEDQEDVVQIQLEPVGGSGASGTAAIVRVADRPAIDVNVSGLKPSGRGEAYVLWLLGSGDKGLPIAFRSVGQDGRFVGRTQVPTAGAGLLPNVDFIDLSLAREEQVGPAVKQAAENGVLPTHIGTSVVRGRLPG